MEKSEFLEQQVFAGLSPKNDGSETDTAYQFSEADFETVLDRAEHYGLGIYTIESFFKGTPYATTTHEDLKKRATDHRWFKRAFLTSKIKQAGLTYAATYKVSPKLLARDTFQDEEE